MKNRFAFLPALLCALLLVSAGDASARVGNGGSVGSRGSLTYQSSPYGGQSISRSTAQPVTNPSYNNQGYAGSAPYGSAPYGSAIGSHPFASGIAGGLLGAGIGHFLFGGGGGYGGYGEGGGIGFFHILLIALVGYYILKKLGVIGGGRSLFGGSNPLQGGGFGGMGASRMDAPSFAPSGGNQAGGNMPGNAQPFSVSDSDKREFEQLLIHIQDTWSSGDLQRLRQYVTPELQHYFSDEMSVNASKGLANKVEQVTLEQADVVESWTEYNLDYATARMRWSALDYMTRLDRKPGDSDYIASGDNNRKTEAQEFWTFVRSSGGHWLLSAIQQPQ